MEVPGESPRVVPGESPPGGTLGPVVHLVQHLGTGLKRHLDSLGTAPNPWLDLGPGNVPRGARLGPAPKPWLGLVWPCRVWYDPGKAWQALVVPGRVCQEPEVPDRIDRV